MKQTVTMQSGQRMTYDDEVWWHRNSVAKGRFSEPKPLYYAALLCLPGHIVIDAGANIGQYSVWLASRGAEVVAIEPIHTTFSILAENLHPYQPNVHGFCCALGDADDKVSFSGGNRPGDELAHVAQRSGKEVHMRRLDSLGIDNIGSVHLLKADVEGYEGNLLRGARETIERDRPYIQLEVEEKWLKRYGWSLRTLERELRDLGYDKHVDYFGRAFNWLNPGANTVFAGVKDKHWLPRLVSKKDENTDTVEP